MKGFGEKKRTYSSANGCFCNQGGIGTTFGLERSTTKSHEAFNFRVLKLIRELRNRDGDE